MSVQVGIQGFQASPQSVTHRGVPPSFAGPLPQRPDMSLQSSSSFTMTPTVGGVGLKMSSSSNTLGGTGVRPSLATPVATTTNMSSQANSGQSSIVLSTNGSVSGLTTLGPFDGRRMRMRGSGGRRTVDYNVSIINYMHNRIWQRDERDMRAIQPDALYRYLVVPPTSLLTTPANAFTTRPVRTALNKIKCPIFCTCWTPEGRRLVTGASSGEFTLWNGLTFSFETILQAHDMAIRAMMWSNNDTWMLTADHGGFVKYWQSNMNNVKTFQAHKDPVRGISFSPSDQKFTTCADDATVRIWDFTRCHEERILRGHGADVKCVGWHPTKGLIASGSKDTQQPLKLWDPRTGSSLATIYAHKNTVMDLKWNRNGNWLLTASRDHLIKLFDIRNMKEEIQSFRGHKKEATTLAWNPVHETLFASGGSDGSIMFWLTGIEKEVGSINEAHEGMVWTLAWHPLGHVIVSGSNDHTTKFWTRNFPGDSMRDRYNLNTLPAGMTDDADYEIDHAGVILPGLDLDVSHLRRSSQDTLVSASDVTSTPAAIPGLDLTPEKSSADSASSAAAAALARKQKAIYTKPIHKEFERAWIDGKKPEINQPQSGMRPGFDSYRLQHDQGHRFSGRPQGGPPFPGPPQGGPPFPGPPRGPPGMMPHGGPNQRFAGPRPPPGHNGPHGPNGPPDGFPRPRGPPFEGGMRAPPSMMRGGGPMMMRGGPGGGGLVRGGGGMGGRGGGPGQPMHEHFDEPDRHSPGLQMMPDHYRHGGDQGFDPPSQDHFNNHPSMDHPSNYDPQRDPTGFDHDPAGFNRDPAFFDRNDPAGYNRPDYNLGPTERPDYIRHDELSGGYPDDIDRRFEGIDNRRDLNYSDTDFRQPSDTDFRRPGDTDFRQPDDTDFRRAGPPSRGEQFNDYPQAPQGNHDRPPNWGDGHSILEGPPRRGGGGGRGWTGETEDMGFEFDSSGTHHGGPGSQFRDGTGNYPEQYSEMESRVKGDSRLPNPAAQRGRGGAPRRGGPPPSLLDMQFSGRGGGGMKRKWEGGPRPGDEDGESLAGDMEGPPAGWGGDGSGAPPPMRGNLNEGGMVRGRGIRGGRFPHGAPGRGGNRGRGRGKQGAGI